MDGLSRHTSGARKQRELPHLEGDRQALALVALTAEPGAHFWRNNTGKFRSMDGRRVVRAGTIGSPDIIGCYRGRFVGIEMKAARGDQRDAQENFERKLTASGGVYAVCRTPDEAVAVLRDIAAGRL